LGLPLLPVEQQRLLGGEVVVDGLLGHATGGGDVADPDRVEALLEEHRGGRVGDALPELPLLAVPQALAFVHGFSVAKNSVAAEVQSLYVFADGRVGDATGGRDVSDMSNAAPAVTAEGLTKRYGNVVAVDGLDLRVEAHSVVALLGPNGAGKTTM